MAKQNINVGTTANDKKGDSLRAAFQKVNANFTELYTELGLVNDVTLSLGAFEFAGSTISTTDSTAIVIDQATTVTSNLNVGGDILPSVANGGDLGSSTLPWRSLYVSNNTIFLGGTALSVNGAGNLLVNGSLITGGTTSYNDLSDKPNLGTYATQNDINTVLNEIDTRVTTISYNDLLNKPNLAGTYQFFVAADDSTQRLISTDELIKFTGAGGITTASDAEGNITITGSGAATGIESETDVSIKVNLSDSTQRIWRFGEDGELTFPNNTVQTDAFSGKSGRTVVLGTNASAPGEFGIALGFNAGANGGAGDYAIALGYGAGLQNQGGGATNTAVAIGMSAGGTNQGARGIAIGREVGAQAQGISAIAIGDAAGNENQGEYSIALGAGTASTTQGIRSIAIGTGAGGVNQGNYAIAIGNYAGTSNQHTNSIILNARSSVLNTSSSNSFYVAPIRNASGTSGLLQYDAATKEVSYSSDIRSETGFSIDVNLSDSTLYRWQFGEDGKLTFPDGANYAGQTVTMPTTTIGNTNSFVWEFSDNSIGSDRITLNWNLLASDTAGFYIGTTHSTTGKYLFLDGTDQSLSYFPDGVPGGGKLIFGSSAGNNAGDANAIEIKATNGDVYLTSTESVKITVDAADSSARIWTFDPTGILTVPGPISGLGNAKLDFTTYGANTAYLTTTSDDTTALIMGTTSAELYAHTDIIIRTNTGGTAKVWNFNPDGSLSLPRMAIGTSAGATAQGLDAVAVGIFAGNATQGTYAVAVGTNAGKTTQGQQSVAIGHDTGYENQGQYATAVGHNAATFNQGNFAVAIGHNAGYQDQGANSVAIGHYAGGVSQGANSIILNATGVQLNQTTANTFTVAPIRNISATSGVLQYNASTKEVSYSNNVTAETFNTDQITVVGNRITTTVTNANLELECNGTGGVVVNGGKLILNTGGNAYVESVDYGVNSANSALNIFGGPYQKINLRAGFGTQATLTLATDGTLTLPGSIVGTATQAVFNTTSTTVNAFGAATTALNIGASGAPITGFAATATTSSTASSLGYLGIPASTVSTTNTLTIADAGEHIYVTTNSQTITIPANASVAYPIGTTLTFIAGPSATTVTIAITSDTLRLAGGTSTGTRTLAANGMATAVKVAATTWYINGTGLT